MTTPAPRAVIVRRHTDYELLLARHATRGQAAFFLESRDQRIDDVEHAHDRIHDALNHVVSRIPNRWRRSHIARDDLDRFLFEPDDVVIAVGQDGLVANIAKYLDGQPVIGVNPLPDRYDGVLVRTDPQRVPNLLAHLDRNEPLDLETRTMVEARLDDTQSLYALNEVFVGHQTHQSARYSIHWRNRHERHSSSGIIVATGTGATGWARSINGSRKDTLNLPAPDDQQLAFFVREAFPSKATGTDVTSGLCSAHDELVLTSEMNQQGVVFGDGIEDDYLTFDYGQALTIRVAERTLNLVAA